MAKSQDLFDNSTMSFGEHLEVLRIHLWRAIIGVVLCVIVSLFLGNQIVAVVRRPIDNALRKHNEVADKITVTDDLTGFSFSTWWNSLWDDETKTNPNDDHGQQTKPREVDPPPGPDDKTTITVEMRAGNVVAVLRQAKFPQLPELSADEADQKVLLRISAPEFAQLSRLVETANSTVTLNVQEAFLTYLKVAFVAGLMFASPWVFYQMWQFVAAGLFPHERKYVYVYLPMSTGLFLGGAAFCFFAVFPFVLNFLLSFNKVLDVNPQIRLSEWISFAILLPLMFGLSFQLPLVMLFLERISIFEANDYRTKRRMAILVIAVISMLLTPADPTSMLMMMFPLIVLYEVGILLCGFSPMKSPFETEAV